ncbi:uncharacterized protein LOC135694393 [Rhopilema esculentum]|uniref:uncharacterized protein LOC135694393 n=1 Tax=Rhopilema esculentum TaxID=499914 RepID=UPI0031D3B7EE|eukprot:gene4794-21103_t
MNALTSPQPPETFEPRESIWAYIEKQTLEEERLEIKKLIGSSLIEETVDLHQEVDTLLEIWRECREENDGPRHALALPEPPNVRENLIKQIQLFVKLLQERSDNYCKGDIRSLSPFQSEVVRNICIEKERSSPSQERPQTARSTRDGRETPLRPMSSGRSSSCSSGFRDHFLESGTGKSTNEIEELADIIRESLEEERNGLHEDIAFLQQCLFDESTFRASAEQRVEEPSLKDLQDIGLRLEKELLVTASGPAENPSKAGHLHEHRQSPTSNSMKFADQRHTVPSPPTSAPTTKSRKEVTRRKQLPAKPVRLTSEDIKTPSSQGYKHSKGITESQSIRKCTSTSTTVTKPCLPTSIGSNSQKLRQLVLECRESQS